MFARSDKRPVAFALLPLPFLRPSAFSPCFPSAAGQIPAIFLRRSSLGPPASFPRWRLKWHHPRPEPRHKEKKAMDMKAGRTREALLDLTELVAKAFFGGLGIAVAMALAILALTPAAQAAGLASPN